MSIDNNPYLPPKAAVADVASDVLPIRPMAVTIALYLIGARALLGLALLVNSMLGARAYSLATLLAAGIALAITITLGMFIARGRNWARIIYLVLTLFALVSLTFTITSIFELPAGVTMRGELSGWWLATITVPPAFSVAVVVLLFGPGRAWFRARG